MQACVHVTVQVPSVGLAVKVSALHGEYIDLAKLHIRTLIQRHN